MNAKPLDLAASYVGLLVAARSKRTCELYKCVVHEFLTSAGDPPWTPQTIILHLNQLAERNASTTLSTKAVIIAAFLRWAALQGLCSSELHKTCAVRRPTAPTPRTADHTEVRSLLAMARPKLRLALLLAAHLGLRESEIRGLRWVDVCFDEGVEAATVLGKGNKLRTLPITNEALLVELRKQRGGALCYTIPGRGGKQLSRGTLGRDLGYLCRKLGIRELNMHSLRHHFASSTHQAGVPLRTVQGMLGHSSISTTEHYLSSLSGVEALRDGMRRITQGA